VVTFVGGRGWAALTHVMEGQGGPKDAKRRSEMENEISTHERRGEERRGEEEDNRKTEIERQKGKNTEKQQHRRAVRF